ncbi:MAG TPA: hypothetical protein VN182_06725 [Flavobacterium sp.]|nr:hypothetical protein [Flavobacterium sp.]
MNYQLKVNAKALNRAFVYPIQGKTEKVECLCIPVSEFYKGKNGELYCTFGITEKQTVGTYGDTHFAKQQLEKESYNRLTEEQKKNIPIIGNMQPAKFGNQPKVEQVQDAVILPPSEKMEEPPF